MVKAKIPVSSYENANRVKKIWLGGPLGPPNCGTRRWISPHAGWILLFLMIVTSLLWGLWPIYRLEVSSVGRPKAPLSFPISSGDRFSIWFLHSYDRAFFQENYEIDPHHQIILREMVFKSHLNGGGFAYPHFRLRPDGVGELKEINESRNKLEFMMGSKDLANHTLIWKEEKIELSYLFQSGEIIQIQAVKMNRLKELLSRLLKSERVG